MSEPLDLQKFSRIISMIGSAYDNEALNAWRLAAAMLRSAGMTLADFIEAYRRAEVATKAAALLLAENASLKAELEQLRSTGTAVALWADVGAQVTSARTGAAWALDLHRQGLVWLSGFEVDFLTRCTSWQGRLTPRMQPVFQRTMDRVVERTGLTPPS